MIIQLIIAVESFHAGLIYILQSIIFILQNISGPVLFQLFYFHVNIQVKIFVCEVLRIIYHFFIGKLNITCAQNCQSDYIRFNIKV